MVTISGYIKKYIFEEKQLKGVFLNVNTTFLKVCIVLLLSDCYIVECSIRCNVSSFP